MNGAEQPLYLMPWYSAFFFAGEREQDIGCCGFEVIEVADIATGTLGRDFRSPGDYASVSSTPGMLV